MTDPESPSPRVKPLSYGVWWNTNHVGLDWYRMIYQFQEKVHSQAVIDGVYDVNLFLSKAAQADAVLRVHHRLSGLVSGPPGARVFV